MVAFEPFCACSLLALCQNAVGIEKMFVIDAKANTKNIDKL